MSDLVIFDLDGTLVDTAPDLLHALNKTLDGVSQPTIELTTIRHIVGKGARAMIEKALEHNGAEPDAFNLDAMFDAFIGYYDADICIDSKPFPGVETALDWFRDAGYNLAICTNKRQGLAEKLLTELSLTHRFKTIVGADVVQRRKPDPNHIHETIVRSGMPDTGRAIMIGDSATDLNAAKAGNIPCLLHEWGYSDVPISELDADGTFGDYADLPDLAAALLSSLDRSA